VIEATNGLPEERRDYRAGAHIHFPRREPVPIGTAAEARPMIYRTADMIRDIAIAAAFVAGWLALTYVEAARADRPFWDCIVTCTTARPTP
jgi:hypothetical protein